MKIILRILLLTQLSLPAFTQSEEDARKILEKINSFDQLDSLIKVYPNWEIKISHTPPIGFFSDSVITNAKIGQICKSTGISNSGIYLHKIIDRQKEEHCKVQIIFLYGNNRTQEEIDSLRTVILEKYSNGIEFNELHKKYNEDGNKTGILDWFCKGIMAPEFENAVWTRKKNDIFVVDVPSNQWHFVVLKIEKNKMLKSTRSIYIRIQ